MNYEDIYSMTTEDIPEDKLLPTGRWLYEGKTVGYMTPKDENGSAAFLFNLEVIRPIDVSDEVLEAELGDNYDYRQNELVHRITIKTPKDFNQVKKFLASIGIEHTGPFFEDKKPAFAKAFRGAQFVARTTTGSWNDKATGEPRSANRLSNFEAVAE